MKITIACKYFSPRGGAQTFLFNLTRKLLEHGHRVKVITMEVKGEMEGVETQTISLPPVPRTFRDVMFARASHKALQQDDHDLSFGEQKTWGADVVRPGGGVHREYISQIIKTHMSVTTRAIAALTKHLSLKEHLNLYIERRLYLDPPPMCVIANSNLVRRHLIKHYPNLADRTTVVHNGVDCERFSPDLKGHRERVRGELHIPQDALVGAFVSFDFRRKGLITALRSLAILKHKPARREVYLIVVGRPKSWAERLAARLDVEDRVRFVGLTAPEPYYGASDLVLLPSYFDPFANVVLEGLACGLPAITSSHTGACEILTPGRDGFYINDSSDAAQFAGFIEYFMDADKLASGSEAARALALKHTLEDHYGEIMAVLTSVAEQKAARRSAGNR